MNMQIGLKEAIEFAHDYAGLVLKVDITGGEKK